VSESRSSNPTSSLYLTDPYQGCPLPVLSTRRGSSSLESVCRLSVFASNPLSGASPVVGQLGLAGPGCAWLAHLTAAPAQQAAVMDNTRLLQAFPVPSVACISNTLLY